MKALVMRGHGDLDQLEVTDVPAPEIARPTDVRIALRAGGLNRLDLWTLAGLPGLSLAFPHVLGGDGAGIVDAIGDSVRDLSPGDRVMLNPGISCYRCDQCLAGEHSLCRTYRLLGEHLPGTIAEFIVVPQHNVVHIPTPPDGELSWAEAGGFSLVALTAWRMVVTRAALRPGESVLIWGIGGGVSSAALQIAKLVNGFTIVTSSSEKKLERARALGADVTLNHDAVDVVQEVRKLVGRKGVDVVIENVGEATWERTLRVLGRGGRVVTCGGTTGPKLTVDVRPMFWYQWTLMGSTMGNHREYEEVVRLLGQGKLRPQIDSTFALDEGVKAMERLASGEQMGKVVVEVAGVA